jgi:dolichyl-phosphate-mannose-protein mannosyltransferase
MQPPLRSAIKHPELALLTALALLTRLWGLFSPRVVVWDEVHFQRYAGAYFSGRYYVDVHPPLGKLLFAGAAKLLGISGAALAANEPTPSLRLLPALAGALIIPVAWLLLREIGASRRVATMAAALLLLDNALLAESRFIFMDGMLIFFTIAAVALYAAARRRSGAAHWRWLVAAAVAAGAAMSTKWTGLSALGLILLAWAVEAFMRRRQRWPWMREALVLVLVPVAIYMGSFAVHFALLRHSGPGDDWMSPEFQATLQGNPSYEKSATAPFLKAFADLNHTMGAINARWATATHEGASRWYTWPIAKHSIGFWSPTETGQNPERWIVLFANPIVWWGALVGMGAMILAATLRSSRKAGQASAAARLTPYRTPLLFLAAGYLLNFIPFAFIRRPMFLYHYLVAMIFSVMLAALGVGALAGWTDDDEDRFWRFPSRRSAILYIGVVALAAGLGLYLAPMSYGWPLSPSAVVHRRWVLERHILM